jgi:hypothetical protein
VLRGHCAPATGDIPGVIPPPTKTQAEWRGSAGALLNISPSHQQWAGLLSHTILLMKDVIGFLSGQDVWIIGQDVWIIRLKNGERRRTAHTNDGHGGWYQNSPAGCRVLFE